MPTPPSASSPRASAPAKSHYNSAYVQIDLFIFNPTLVTGCLHRLATGDESVAVTEVFYGSHYVSVEDLDQKLFLFLRRHTTPETPATTI